MGMGRTWGDREGEKNREGRMGRKSKRIYIQKQEDTTRGKKERRGTIMSGISPSTSIKQARFCRRIYSSKNCQFSLEFPFVVIGIGISAVVANVRELRVIADFSLRHRLVILDQKAVFLGGGGSLLLRDGIRARHPFLVPFHDGGVTSAP